MSSKKMIQKTQKVANVTLAHRPMYHGEKNALTPPVQPKMRPSWFAPKPRWKELNVHHHTRKFDRAYIRSKTIA